MCIVLLLYVEGIKLYYHKYVCTRACLYLFIVNDQNKYYNYSNMYNGFGGYYARIYITTL